MPVSAQLVCSEPSGVNVSLLKQMLKLKLKPGYPARTEFVLVVITATQAKGLLLAHEILLAPLQCNLVLVYIMTLCQRVHAIK